MPAPAPIPNSAIDRPHRCWNALCASAHWQRLLAVALVAALAAASVCAEPFTVRTLPAGFDGPLYRSAVAADFNGTGRTSWYAGGRNISHFPHGTAMTTLPAVGFAGCPGCPEDAHDFAVFDVDRDGDADIVRVLLWPGVTNTVTLQVYLNDGAGGFSLGARVDWSEAPQFDYGSIFLKLAAADFDRDGRTDLAVMTTYQKTDRSQSKPIERGKLVLRWNGGGSFEQTQIVQSQHLSSLSELLAVDLDRDGFAELVATHVSEYYQDSDGKWIHFPHYRVFRNDRQGWFTVETSPGMRLNPSAVDLDRDGWPDLVFGALGQPGFSWQSNNRAGVLGAESLLQGGPTGSGMSPYAFAELDEDGVPDLVTAENDGSGPLNRLMLRKGSGAGLGAPFLVANLPAGITAIAAADIDGDGDVDLLLRLADGSARLLQNLAQRLFPAARVQAGIELPGATGLVAADVDRDGNHDLIALAPGAARFYLYPGTGTGAFGAPTFRPTSGAPADFVVDDFDSDGRPDLAYVVPASGAVRWVRQASADFGGWVDAEVATYPGAARIRSGRLIPGRLSPDLLVASDTTGGVRWLTNPKQGTNWGSSTVLASHDPIPRSILAVPQQGLGDSPFVLSADGAGVELRGYRNVLGWAKHAELLMVQDAPQQGVMIEADIDGQPGSEIVLVDGIGRLAWWKPVAQSWGLVSGVIDAQPPGEVRALAAIDWNRDGRTDIVAGMANRLYLFAREGAGETWTRRDLEAGQIDARALAVLDLNRDGLPDVAVLDGQSGRILRVSNDSRILQLTSATGPTATTVTPGQAGTAFSIGIRNPGRPNDASIAVTRSRVLFRKAVADGDGWKPGEAMSKADVQQAVQNVAMVVNNQLLAIAGTGNVAADGGLTIEHNALGTLAPISGEQTQNIVFRVALRSDAGQAGYSRFFLQHDPGSNVGQARVLHDGAPVGKTGTFRATAMVRIDIAQAAGGQGRVFASGFEP